MKLTHTSKILAFGFLALLASCSAIEGMGRLKSWLPKFGAQPKATREQINDAKHCTICLSDFTAEDFTKKDQLTVLNCDPKAPHIFHKKCLKEWTDTGHSTCPICRNALLCGNTLSISNTNIENIELASFLIAASALMIWFNNRYGQNTNLPSLPFIRNLAFLSTAALSCGYLFPQLLGSSKFADRLLAGMTGLTLLSLPVSAFIPQVKSIMLSYVINLGRS